MRVVHIAKVSGIAGSERHLLTLLRALRLRGVDTRMIVLEPRGGSAVPFCNRLAASGVAVARVPITADIDPFLTRRLTTALEPLAPDIVHTHLLHADLYGQEAARRLGIAATVSTRHNTDPFRHNAMIRWMNGRAMRSTGRIIAISRAVTRFVVSVEGCAPARVVTIPYGFEPGPPEWSRMQVRRTLGLADADAVIGVFARLTRQKGVDVLLRAFRRLAPEHTHARLLIVGDGPERARLGRQASASGLADRVTFTGWVDEASALMPAADIVAIPSRWEGFCLAAVEAMAAGRAVVASDVDALKEVIERDETGILVPPDDPDALADVLGALLADSARVADLGAHGALRAARQFPVDAMLNATLAVYADLLGTRSEPALAQAMSK